MKPEFKLEGFKEARTALRRLEPELVPELRDGLKAAVTTRTVPTARAKATADSKHGRGRLAASIRAGVNGTTVYIMGGKAAVPYFGWRDFGGDLKPSGRRFNTQTRPFLKRGRYLYPAVDETMPALLLAAAAAFDQTARKVGFNGQ